MESQLPCTSVSYPLRSYPKFQVIFVTSLSTHLHSLLTTSISAPFLMGLTPTEPPYLYLDLAGCPFLFFFSFLFVSFRFFSFSFSSSLLFFPHFYFLFSLSFLLCPSVPTSEACLGVPLLPRGRGLAPVHSAPLMTWGPTWRPLPAMGSTVGGLPRTRCSPNAAGPAES